MYDGTGRTEMEQVLEGEKNFCQFDPKDTKKRLFVIDTPPPNTTGGLHMGHVFWTCYVDSIARYNRMKGFNVLYPIGWDAHGFPTEIAVEKNSEESWTGRNSTKNA